MQNQYEEKLKEFSVGKFNGRLPVGAQPIIQVVAIGFLFLGELVRSVFSPVVSLKTGESVSDGDVSSVPDGESVSDFPEDHGAEEVLPDESGSSDEPEEKRRPGRPKKNE